MLTLLDFVELTYGRASPSRKPGKQARKIKMSFSPRLTDYYPVYKEFYDRIHYYTGMNTRSASHAQ
jgi:hypothetical protein